MSKELFDKLYKEIQMPFVILSIVLFNFSYYQWGIRIDHDLKFSLLLIIVVLGAACVAFYIFIYFLIRNYYDGEGKKKCLRWLISLGVLGLLESVISVFQIL